MNLYNVSEKNSSLLRRVFSRLHHRFEMHYVMCTEAAHLDCYNETQAQPQGSSFATVAKLHAIGQHTANGGRTTDQMIAAMRAFSGHTPARCLTYEQALEYLRQDFSLAVAVDYGKFGTSLVAPGSFAFARGGDAWHDVAVNLIENGTDPRVWVRDPLRNAGWGVGKETKWSAILHAVLDPTDIVVYPRRGWA